MKETFALIFSTIALCISVYVLYTQSKEEPREDKFKDFRDENGLLTGRKK